MLLRSFVPSRSVDLATPKLGGLASLPHSVAAGHDRRAGHWSNGHPGRLAGRDERLARMSVLALIIVGVPARISPGGPLPCWKDLLTCGPPSAWADVPPARDPMPAFRAATTAEISVITKVERRGPPSRGDLADIPDPAALATRRRRRAGPPIEHPADRGALVRRQPRRPARGPRRGIEENTLLHKDFIVEGDRLPEGRAEPAPRSPCSSWPRWPTTTCNSSRTRPASSESPCWWRSTEPARAADAAVADPASR